MGWWSWGEGGGASGRRTATKGAQGGGARSSEGRWQGLAGLRCSGRQSSRGGARGGCDGLQVKRSSTELGDEGSGLGDQGERRTGRRWRRVLGRSSEERRWRRGLGIWVFFVEEETDLGMDRERF
ncbi:uncharacterized protein A4U43_C06F18940 [Asparagus officinalis]|uniref:Uncharacterized protein n=1 Tax=Asparagus officinalis TaxID=4686 RepID=A0A5P1EMU5_ASPOF|nr:uncharacterized protein A4U43_C06F18940 [Asparagus officinalis]